MDPELHRTLNKQIIKYLGGNLNNPPKGWSEFINAISLSYKHADEDRELIERSLEISSNELTELNRNLINQNEIVEKRVQERTKELKEEQSKLRASINSLEIGYFMIDLENNIIMHNDVAEEMFTHNTVGVINDKSNKREPNIDDIQAQLGEGFNLKQAITACIKQQLSQKKEEVILGEKFLKFHISPIISIQDQEIPSKSVIGAVALIEDVTEEKIIERSKNEFFSIASHELRTPLTVVQGYSDLIRSDYSHLVDKNEGLEEDLNAIITASTRLMTIVNDLLDVSGIEQGILGLQKEDIDICQFISNTVDEQQTIAESKKIYLKFDVPKRKIMHVIADPNRLKKVLVNLLSNALRFTSQGGVTVAVDQMDGFVKVIVSDTGIGIPEHNRQLLFRKFQQATDDYYVRNSEKGTGIGLYLSRLMVRYMGGEMVLEHSTIGKGSAFSFTIPVASKDAIKT